jgi:hypothetical protein
MDDSPEPRPLGERPSKPSSSPFPLALGQLVGWMGVAAVDAAMMSATSRHALAVHRGDRALHYLYDLGLALAAGLLSMLAVQVAHRAFASRSVPAPLRAHAGSIRLAALAAIAIAVGFLVLGDDVSGLASRSRLLPRPLLIVFFALTIPAVAVVSKALRDRLATHRRAGLFLIASGLAVAVANHLVLEHDYDGLHLFASWAGTIVVAYGVAIDDAQGQAQADKRRSPSRARRWAGAAAFGLMAAGAVYAVALVPPNGIRVDLVRARGGSLGPFVAKWRRSAGVSRTVTGVWFGDRDAVADVPPSSPSLLGKSPVVVLVTIDALRADVVYSGKQDDRLPTFARLREESVEFTVARTMAPATSAAMASLFTGKYFSQLYWAPRTRGSPLICTHDDTSLRFPEILAANGVKTVTFTGMPGLVNDVGFVRGFQEESLIPGRPFAMAREITDALLARLRRLGPEPLFLYVHFTDAHAPYDEGGTQGSDFDRYVREVAIVDAQLRRIRDLLAQVAPDRGALIVSADHGEAFGEHGTRYHGGTLYEELLRVPLLMRVPGVAPAKIAEPVSLMDLGPTILDLLGTPTPGAFMGQSLVPYLRGQHPTLTRPLAMESSRGKLAMIFPDGMKIIEDTNTGTRELYDLPADPGELVNLADTRPDVAAQLSGILFGLHDEHALRRPGYTPPFVR